MNDTFDQIETIEVKTSGGFKIICKKHILYVKAEKKFSIIHFDNHIEIITYNSLKWYSKYLANPLFFRCHNSYIVNCCLIDCYNYKEVIMKGGEKILLARNRRESFKGNLELVVQRLS